MLVSDSKDDDQTGESENTDNNNESSEEDTKGTTYNPHINILKLQVKQ